MTFKLTMSETSFDVVAGEDGVDDDFVVFEFHKLWSYTITLAINGDPVDMIPNDTVLLVLSRLGIGTYDILLSVDAGALMTATTS